MSFLPKFMIKPVRPYLRATVAYFRRIERLLRGTSTVLHAMYRESLLSTERASIPKGSSLMVSTLIRRPTRTG